MLSSENAMLHWIQKAVGHRAALRHVSLRTECNCDHTSNIVQRFHCTFTGCSLLYIRSLYNLLLDIYSNGPIPVATRSKARVCGRSTAGMVGLNPAGGMDVWLLRLLCVVRWTSLRRADHSSRGALPSVVYLLFLNLDREAWAQCGCRSKKKTPRWISLHFNST